VTDCDCCRHLRTRVHQHRIGAIEKYRQQKSWVR
jgi:hypothetical protein